MPVEKFRGDMMLFLIRSKRDVTWFTGHSHSFFILSEDRIDYLYLEKGYLFLHLE